MAGTEAEELEGVKQVLDGTTAGTPVLSIVTQLTNLNSALGTLNTRLSSIETAIDNMSTGDGTAAAIQEQTRAQQKIGAADVVRGEQRRNTRTGKAPRSVKDLDR